MSQQVPLKDIIQEFCTKNAQDLIYIEEYGSFFFWRDGWYEELSKKAFEKMLYSFTDEYFPKQAISKAFFENTFKLSTIICPRQIENGEEFGGYISFNDKVLDTKTFEVLEKNRELICMHYINKSLEELSEGYSCPMFMKFLETSLVDSDTKKIPDKELISLVQEMMGFFLIDSNKGAAAFFLVGDGSNGKSTLIKVIEKIIGLKFISNMTIQALTTNIFNPPSLIGKKINISSEESSKYLEDSMFKALVTNDRISGQRKFGDPINFTPKCKFLFATNKLPTFKDITHALRRRVKIVPFYRIIRDADQDKELDDKLEKELVGIIGWAIEGAKRFVKNGNMFSKSQAAEERMIEFENETSAALRFIRDNYEVDSSSFISNQDLYDHYKEWCKNTGRNAKNNDNFFLDITHNIHGVENIRRTVDGSQVRGKNLRKSDIKDGFTKEEKENINVDELEF